jgi:hypothetical protein
MGVRNTSKKRDLAEELARVKRRIDQAVFELAEARTRMTNNQAAMDDQSASESAESEMATLCISLELSLADAVAWAQRLAEKVRGSVKPVKVGG